MGLGRLFELLTLDEEWWFAFSNVIVVLTDSADPRHCIKKMRSRDPALDVNWGTTCTPLALLAPDGKMRETNCANTQIAMQPI